MEIAIEFGKIEINGEVYQKDVIIYPDRIELRRKEISKNKKEKHGHTPLTKEELEKTIKENYDFVLIGTGIYGKLPIEFEALEYLKSKAKFIIIGKSPDIAKILEEFKNKGKTLAIIHITC